MSLARMGTANMYNRTINNIVKQQSELTNQMEHVSAGKRVIRASDDPVAAAQAERARNRLERIANDQRGLEAQSATIKYGESTLGEINDVLQSFRSFLVNAGNGAFTQVERDTLVEQLRHLRQQMQTYVNRRDSNDLPLFRGLDTHSSLPFPNGTEGVQSGQTNNGEFSIANTLDGVYAFFSGKTGNGILDVAINPDNKGKAHADVGAIKNPEMATALAPSMQVDIRFYKNAAGDGMEYELTLNNENGDRIAPPLAPPLAPLLPPFDKEPWGERQAYQSEKAISVAGMDLVIKGAPEEDDFFTVQPSQTTDVFSVLDEAIRVVTEGSNPDGSTNFGALSHGISKALSELDIALNRVSTVRGLAGDLLNQAERMGSTLLMREEQIQAQRVAAEDYDPEGMVRAISQLETQKTAVSTALQSYASIQKLSLFNYIN